MILLKTSKGETSLYVRERNLYDGILFRINISSSEHDKSIYGQKQLNKLLTPFETYTSYNEFSSFGYLLILYIQ